MHADSSPVAPRILRPDAPLKAAAKTALKTAGLVVLTVAALTAATLAEEAPTDGDARAQVLADHVLEAMGGREAWEATRYLEFDFFGRRHHLWDRWTGAHRVEGTDRDGRPWVVLHDIDERGEGDGAAFVEGRETTGEERRDLLRSAYAAWVNDTYWLLMPYKLRDPGVRLTSDGTEEIGGVVYDKLLLSFSDVGLTPGDRYWAFINRETGLMDRWAFILESQDPNGPPSVWRWDDWQRYGGILLSPTRRQVGGDERVLSLAPITVHESVDESRFTRP